MTGHIDNNSRGLSRRAMLGGAGAAAAALSVPAAAARPFPLSRAEGAVNILNLDDLEPRAAKVIEPGAFGFIQSGAGDEWSLRENRAAFDRTTIVPRVYTGAVSGSLRTKLLDLELELPFIAPPTAGQKMAHEGGEVTTAKGIAQAGGLMTLSTESSNSMEEVAAASAGPKWFQLYQQEDDGITCELLQRAKAAGYTAIVHTLDVTAASNRERNRRSGFRFGQAVTLGNLASQKGRSIPKRAIGWKDLEFVQKVSGLPVVSKGILHPDDAAQAVRNGVAAIWASNHGGRQLDGAPAAFTMLPAIRESMQGRVPLIADGGFRRGQHVFKAIARGADAIAIGRPMLYGLALGGSAGVAEVFRHLADELRMVMTLAGTADLAAIKRATLRDF